MKPLSPRQSRSLALVLLAAVLLLALAIVAGPFVYLHFHYDQAIEKQTDLLGRYMRIAAAAPELSRQLAVLSAKDPRSFYLKSTVPALAASEVQEMAKGVIESKGGKIVSLQIPEHKDDGGFRKVTVNIQMMATTAATQKIFYALETQRPYFLLDNVTIRSTVWRPQRDANAAAVEAEHAVQFDLLAYAVLVGK